MLWFLALTRYKICLNMKPDSNATEGCKCDSREEYYTVNLCIQWAVDHNAESLIVCAKEDYQCELFDLTTKKAIRKADHYCRFLSKPIYEEAYCTRQKYKGAMVLHYSLLILE